MLTFCSNSGESGDTPTITCSWTASSFLPRWIFYLRNGTSKSISGKNKEGLSEFCMQCQEENLLLNNTGSHEFVCRIIRYCTAINDVTVSCEEEGVSSTNVTFLARDCENSSSLITPTPVTVFPSGNACDQG
jgi:hypothetical protein